MFDPNSPITREEVSIMIDKALRYKGITGELVAKIPSPRPLIIPALAQRLIPS
ncbi:hypothetical protein ACT4UM_12685 [Bacillus sp. SS-TM]